MVPITKFSEPVNFLIAPLIYLFTSERLGDKRGSRDWIHFILFLLWFGYCFFCYTQSTAYKNYYLLDILEVEKKAMDTFAYGNFVGGKMIIDSLRTPIKQTTYLTMVLKPKKSSKTGASMYRRIPVILDNAQMNGVLQ